MPWNPEDWNEWLPEPTAPCGSEPAHVHATRRILRRLPGKEFKTVAFLERGPAAPLLADEPFAGVFAVDLDATGLGGFRRCLDVVVALEPIVRSASAETDALLEQVRGSLVEGGVFVGTFAARARDAEPFTLPLPSGGTPGFHEFELQYRLRRMGFQGLRVKRLKASPEQPETILCMAVRRACN